jgi:hypothetical protein
MMGFEITAGGFVTLRAAFPKRGRPSPTPHSLFLQAGYLVDAIYLIAKKKCPRAVLPAECGPR